jgi:membrane-associated protein
VSSLVDWVTGHATCRIEGFFERHGGKSLVASRFVPFVRIFAPWMAGAAQMPLRRFVIWNVAGGTAWVSVVTLAGFLFGASLAVAERSVGPAAAAVAGALALAVFGWHRVRAHG